AAAARTGCHKEHGTAGVRPLRGQTSPRDAVDSISRAVQRPRRRANAGAPVPASAGGGRALGGRRPRAGHPPGRRGHCPLERHVRDATRAAQPRAPRRRRPHCRGARRRAPAERGAGHVNNGEPWWISLIKAAILVNLVMRAFAYTTWLERKLLGRMQNRYGPNRAGPYGLLQPIADLIKLIRKESFFPVAARDGIYIAAPIISLFTALAAFAVIPFGAGWQISDYHVNGAMAN